MPDGGSAFKDVSRMLVRGEWDESNACSALLAKMAVGNGINHKRMYLPLAYLTSPVITPRGINQTLKS